MSPSHSGQPDPPTARRGRRDQVSALLWLVVGAIVIGQSQELDYMAEYGPGPGFLPSWLGVLVVFLGSLLLARAVLRRGDGEGLELPSRLAARQMLLVMAGFFAFVVLAEKVGFILCVGLLFLFLLTVVERRKRRFSRCRYSQHSGPAAARPDSGRPGAGFSALPSISL